MKYDHHPRTVTLCTVADASDKNKHTKNIIKREKKRGKKKRLVYLFNVAITGSKIFDGVQRVCGRMVAILHTVVQQCDGSIWTPSFFQNL